MRGPRKPQVQRREAESRAVGGDGSPSASWLSGVVREAWGEKALERVPLWATQELRSGGKLRTESLSPQTAAWQEAVGVLGILKSKPSLS